MTIGLIIKNIQMKNILRLSVLLMVLLTLGSCKKYLDIEPTGRVIPTTADDFRALLTSAYAGFPAQKSLVSLRTDELVLDEYGTDFPGLRDIYKWNDNTPDAITYPYPYVGLYNTIFYANEVIANVEAKAGKNTATDQMKGEAYLLRAYTHFELLNLYAKPYNKATAATDRGIALALKMDLEQNYTLSTVAEVYNQILADIAEGQKFLNVNNWESGKNYRFSIRSAWALQARVYEYMGDWANTLSTVQKVLAVNRDLQDLNVSGALLPNHYQSVENILSLEEAFNSLVSNSTYISEHLLGIYDHTNDLRFAMYFSKSGGDYVSKKGNSDALKITFRNGEMYLIQAEAALQTGKPELALQSLLDLKAKRLKPAYYATERTRISALGNAALMQEIISERERELALEGHRWFDLRRYGQPSMTHSVNFEDFTLRQNDPRYTIRFPQSAIANNPNLQ